MLRVWMVSLNYFTALFPQRVPMETDIELFVRTIQRTGCSIRVFSRCLSSTRLTLFDTVLPGRAKFLGLFDGRNVATVIRGRGFAIMHILFTHILIFLSILV